jgi:hypothetical protein
MLIEILANVGMSMQMFLRGTPEEETINENIRRLLTLDWFHQLYAQHQDFFKKDQDVRVLIGRSKIDKILPSEKKQLRLQRKIEELVES